MDVKEPNKTHIKTITMSEKNTTQTNMWNFVNNKQSSCQSGSCSTYPPTQTHTLLTTHKAAGRGLEDAGALEALWVGTGGVDTGLQSTCHQPLGQPVELAVTQEAVALNKTVEERRGGRHMVYITSIASLIECVSEGFEVCVHVNLDFLHVWICTHK